MIVGILKAQLNLNGITSLKDKRSIVKSLTSRLRNRFNVSVAEVAHNDNKHTAIVAAAIVANDSQFIDSQLEKIVSFMQRDGRFYLGPMEREIF